MDNEKTPALKKGKGSELESLEERIARQEERFERNMKCLMGCCLSTFVIVLFSW